MIVRDELMVDRYVFYLFLISTHTLAFGEPIPSDSCDVDVVKCQNGHITEFQMSEYLTLNQ